MSSTFTKGLIIAATLALAFVAPVQSVPAGAAAGMDLALVKNIKNYVMPTILSSINTLQLPRIDYKGGYVENLAFSFNIKSNDSVTFQFDPTQNAVILTANEIFGQITGKFKQRLLLISATGNFKAAFNDGGISFRMVIPLHSQNVNGRIIPKVDVKDFQISFDTRKIKISIWGSFLADIGDIFIGLFKGSIIRSIGTGINTGVPPLLNDSIQNLLVASNGILPLYNGLSFDFQVPQDPVVTNETLGLYLNATFFNQTTGYKTPVDSPITNVTLNFTEKNQILIDTSCYSIDSILLTVQDLDIFDVNITQELLGPVYGPHFLNTTFADGVWVGLKAKYGPDQPMSLRVQTTKAPTSFFKPGTLGIRSTYDISVFVNQDLAIKFEVIDADGAISVNVTNGVLKFQLLTLVMNDAKVLESQVGEIDIWETRVFINWMMTELLIPIVNNFLNEGLTLPNDFFGIIHIQDATFTAMDGYVQVGISPRFL